jgi:hypothetical protein
MSATPTWEKVTVNRKTKTMTTEGLFRNTDGSVAITDRAEFWEQDGNVKTTMDVFGVVARSYKVETYKKGLETTIKAIKFAQFEAEA